MNSRIIIYYHNIGIPVESSLLKKSLRTLKYKIKSLLGLSYVSGVDAVFENLKKSFEKLNISYLENIPFDLLLPEDRVIVLGRDTNCLNGYNKENKIVAGIGLMTHPIEWIDLLKDFPVACYLQHTEWPKNVYQKYFGEVCDIWPVGIDTDFWKPSKRKIKYDFIIYNKIKWNKVEREKDLVIPLIGYLNSKGYKFKILKYGGYNRALYKSILNQSKAMIFLSEHESQGIAYQECLSCDVPVLAWDQGFIVDPYYKKFEGPSLKVSSVPIFSEKCGMTFKDFHEFTNIIPDFLEKQNKLIFKPRSFVIENISLEFSGKRMIEILNNIYME